MSNKNLRIIIIGGLGFIGQALTYELNKEGLKPLIVDKRTPNVRTSNKLSFTFFQCDITNSSKLHTLVNDKNRNSTVVNLAALHYIPFCNKHPSATINTNVSGMFNVVQLANAITAQRFIFASSLAVYKPTKSAVTERSILGPTDVYGLSKLLGENILKHFSNFPYRIFRIANVYGPGDKTPHLIPEILRQAKHGNILKLGNLNTFRDYIYIDDVVQALHAEISNVSKNKEEIVNLGTGIGTNGKQIVRIVGNLLKQKLKIQTNRHQTRDSDRPYLVCNPSKVKQLHYLYRFTTFKDGLRLTLSK